MHVHVHVPSAPVRRRQEGSEMMAAHTDSTKIYRQVGLARALTYSQTDGRDLYENKYIKSCFYMKNAAVVQ